MKYRIFFSIKSIDETMMILDESESPFNENL